jgi:dTDP-4-amino-4,6-dideoxygalactose transaminase
LALSKGITDPSHKPQEKGVDAMQVPFVDLGVQYKSIKDELEVEFQKVFSKTAFIMGPAVKEFEEDFAQYCGVKHAIGVVS